MKCKDCVFWNKCDENEDYGGCNNVNEIDFEEDINNDKVYIISRGSSVSVGMYTHKNHCCTSFVAKITKE